MLGFERSGRLAPAGVPLSIGPRLLPEKQESRPDRIIHLSRPPTSPPLESPSRQSTRLQLPYASCLVGFRDGAQARMGLLDSPGGGRSSSMLNSSRLSLTSTGMSPTMTQGEGKHKCTLGLSQAPRCLSVACLCRLAVRLRRAPLPAQACSRPPADPHKAPLARPRAPPPAQLARLSQGPPGRGKLSPGPERLDAERGWLRPVAFAVLAPRLGARRRPPRARPIAGGPGQAEARDQDEARHDEHA